ncbi:hypothetical protein [Streptomyces sp. NPDC058657]|uniref:hypothetical protein n=1 Tax=unclassified Streptomyces TaxID=2593676 RepID=UPI0036492E03
MTHTPPAGTTASRSRRQFYWHNLRVPFIAPWSTEKVYPGRVVKRSWRHGLRIGYADESSVDRRHGTLWVRHSAVRGAGTPDMAAVHPLRQRQAMSHLLCQVCGESTFDVDFERWGERFLFLVRAGQGRQLGEGELTATPPVHAACALESVRDCPHLRTGHLAALVKRVQPWGVSGFVHDPKSLRPLYSKAKDGLTSVAYENPSIHWTLATRDISTLHGCTPVGLHDLAARSAT